VRTYTHQLRHACGYYLANKGCDLRLIQEYLGHKQIQNTVRYTALNAKSLRGFGSELSPRRFVRALGNTVRQRRVALFPPLSAELIIPHPPSAPREPMPAPRLRHYGSRRASRPACREHHRTRLARAALSSGALDERERPAREWLPVCLPCLPVSRCGRRGLSWAGDFPDAARLPRLWVEYRAVQDRYTETRC
jgi:hypothetical protein